MHGKICPRRPDKVQTVYPARKYGDRYLRGIRRQD